MTINNFKAKTVDLSALPLLNTLKATGGDIEKIIFHKESLDSAMKNLDVKNNNFTLINLPPRGKNVNTALNYYAPQKVMPTIPDVITVNTPVDLSAWVFGQSLEGNVASQIVWETSLEEILQEGKTTLLRMVCTHSSKPVTSRCAPSSAIQHFPTSRLPSQAITPTITASLPTTPPLRVHPWVLKT